MSFAENLQCLRKRKNITQEQLAEQLEVSRQSVSKWESGQSYPEMEKLLQICNLFHCSMETMMKGDISRDFAEDTHGYDKFQEKFIRLIAFGVGLILFGISIMFLLNGMGLEEVFATAVFFVFLIVAVMILVVMGLQEDRFRQKYPVIEDFYSEEEKELAYRKFTVRIAAGIGTILVAVLLAMLFDGRIEMNQKLGIFEPAQIERLESLAAGIFMLMIAAAVTILVYGGMEKSKYNIEQYNREGNPSPEKKKRDELKGKLCGCIMLGATIIYLVLSFYTERWDKTWLVFAVGGIMCGIVGVALSRNSD